MQAGRKRGNSSRIQGAQGKGRALGGSQINLVRENQSLCWVSFRDAAMKVAFPGSFGITARGSCSSHHSERQKTSSVQGGKKGIQGNSPNFEVLGCFVLKTPPNSTAVQQLGFLSLRICAVSFSRDGTGSSIRKSQCWLGPLHFPP